jgi:hypothetical protein
LNRQPPGADGSIAIVYKSRVLCIEIGFELLKYADERYSEFAVSLIREAFEKA